MKQLPCIKQYVLKFEHLTSNLELQPLRSLYMPYFYIMKH